MLAIARGKDHFGHKRTTSEDVFRLYDDLGLYIVCDGSRDEDGRWAAETICDVIHSEIKERERDLAEYRQAPTRDKRLKIELVLAEALHKASATVHKAIAVDRARKPSSSAVDAVLFLGDVLISAHVGNTRLYLTRNGQAHLLTRDHTYYQEMLEAIPKGSQSSVNPAFKKRLTRAIGDAENVPAQVGSISLMAGDSVLICSNGISDAFTEGAPELARACQANEHSTLAARLVELALHRGIDDNMALIALQIEAEREAQAVTPPANRDARKQLALLRSIQVFKSIHADEAALMKIQGLLTFRTVPKGDVIVQEGSPSDEMFVIISGRVDIQTKGVVVAERGSNEVLGEMGFFSRELRSATVVATEACELMSIQRWDFDALVEKDPWLGYRIVTEIVIELSTKLRVRTDGVAQALSGPKR